MRWQHVFTSFFLHLMLVLLFIFNSENEVYGKKPQFIDINELKLDYFKEKSKGVDAKVKTTISRSKNKYLNDKSDREKSKNFLHNKSINEYYGDSIGAESSSHYEDSSEADRGVEFIFKEGLELQRTLEEIWRIIKAYIYFHPDFFIGRVQGSVKAQVVLDPLGQIIDLKSIYGKNELTEWVKTSLHDALGKPVLKRSVSKNLDLNLHFLFKIVSQPPLIESYNYKGKTLLFNINGYQPPGKTFELASNSFLGRPKMFRHSEWNFSKKIEPYKKACLNQNNKIGCEYLLKSYSTLGLKKEALDIQKKLDLLILKQSHGAIK